MKKLLPVILLIPAIYFLVFFAQNNNSIAFGNDVSLFSPLAGAWTTGAPVPTPTYFGSGSGYTRNDSGWIFVLGGNAPTASNLAMKYNVRADSWQALSPMPYNVVVQGSAVVKDSVYSFGGYLNGGSPCNNFYKYDINSNLWSARANLPGNASFCKGAGYQDSLIYICQGYDGTGATATIWLYNTKTNSYRTCTSLPAPRFGGAFAISGDTLLYVAGADLSVFYSQTYRGIISQSDRSVISWNNGTSIPAYPMGTYRIDAHNWGCKGIIITGPQSSQPGGNNCFTYSPGLDLWTNMPNKPTNITATQSGTVRLAGNIWKFVCASGFTGSITTGLTEIFTDTLCPPQTPPGIYTICKNNGLSGFIPDLGILRDTIIFNLNPNLKVRSIRVRLDTVLHTYDADLDISLSHAGVNNIDLTSDNGGAGANYIGTVLFDSAAVPITSGTAPFTGTFRPEASMITPLYNIVANGIWVLNVFDDLGGDSGYLKQWCITIDTRDPDAVEGYIGIVPEKYILSQNYPNPFNPSTFIRFGLPTAGEIKLIVYDVIGREVKILVNEFKQAGTYNINFDAGDLSSGIYFYTLEAGDKFKMTKKMLLVK